VDSLGARRVLLVATGQRRALAEELAEPLGDRFVGVFTSVKPHVPIEGAYAGQRPGLVPDRRTR
jgi:hypothetical protein